MPDPRCNATAAEMAAALARCESFAICGHVSADGDCLGSALALGHALRIAGKRVDVLLAEDAVIEDGLHFLPGFDSLTPAERYTGAPEAFVYVDVSVRSRIGKAVPIADGAAHRFAIDHHQNTEEVAELNFIEPEAASCTMLVWEVIRELGVEPTEDIATCAYTGLMTDTGRFTFQNADAAAFSAASEMVAAGAVPSHPAREFYQSRTMASLALESIVVARAELIGGDTIFSYHTLKDMESCGAVQADAESFIDILRSVRGVRVACLLKEREGFVRGSLRAKDDVTDVSEIARMLGGGGHRAAAGFTLDEPFDQAVSRVKDLLAELGGAQSKTACGNDAAAQSGGCA